MLLIGMMLDMGQAGPSDPLALLIALPISHPPFIALLSRLPNPLPISKSLSKLVGRLNACLLGSTGSSSAADKAIAWVAVAVLVGKDEGLVVDHGKGWLDAAMGAVAVVDLPVATALPAISLLKSLVQVSSRFPSFERESVQPSMGKLAVSLGRLLERCAGEGDLRSLMVLLEATKFILIQSPAPFRASSAALRSILRAMILNLPLPLPTPSSSTGHPINALSAIKIAAANLLAHLHLTAGKSQASSVWATDMRDAQAGLGYAIDGFVQDAYVQETRTYASPPVGLPILPSDPAQRITVALDLIDGFTEMIASFLSVSTNRPVVVPIHTLVQVSLRCLDLTLQSPLASHISPLHQALLTGSLPRLWTAGLVICGTVMTVCGDHLLPHLSNILDHTTFLLEQTTISMTASIQQLLSLHSLFFTLYPPALVPLDYPTRILKFCLARSGGLLEKRDTPIPVVNGVGGKRGKKRARGAEDGLIGSLEGREARPVSADEAEIILASLKLVPTLHVAPLLSPSLLTLSIRVNLSLYLRLVSLAPTTFARPSDLVSVTEAVVEVLERAATMTENQGGMTKGWKTVILSVLPSRGDRFSALLHPPVPPLMRPQPPLNALHFFAPEGEEERKMRLELGITRIDDDESADDRPMDDLAGNISISHPTVFTPPQSNGVSAPKSTALTMEKAAPIRTEHAAPTGPIAQSQIPNPPQPAIEPPEDSVPSIQPMDLDAEPTGTNAASHEAQGESTSVPFISYSDKGKSTAPPAPVAELHVVNAGDDDDEPIPELDSGSSVGFDSDDEEE